MIKRKKRGFTIVELVIVIAVIGILSAILIPIFSGLVNKANLAADSVLVDSINKQLKIAEVEDGKNTTMYDALLDAKEAGYLVGNINARSSNTLVWDQEADRFALLDSENQVIAGESKNANIKVKLWKIYSEVPALANQEYSIYYSGSETIASQNLKVGFDVGESENVKKINYSNSGTAQEVVIRTNGGELNINAKNDNVIHYGYADSVNVVDVASSSYHENGTVKFLEVAAGRIVLEREAEVSAVHFTATGEGESAKFQNDEGKKISVDISSVKQSNMPTFSRDAVVIEENGTYVAEVKSETSEYIWLFGNGIKEQMVVSDTPGAIATEGSLKPGVEIGAEDGSVAEQVANPAKRNEQGELLDENDQVVDISEIDLTKADALEDTVVVEEIPSKEETKAAAIMFVGGSGTEQDPFLIDSYKGLLNIDSVSSGTGNDSLYFKLVKDMDVASYDSANWCHTDLYNDTTNYHIDLNKHTLFLGNTYLYGYAVNLEMYNGTIQVNGVGGRSSVIGYACYQDSGLNYNVNFHDIVLTGKSESNNAAHYGPLVSYAFGINSGDTSVFTAENIVNNITIESINSTGYVGGLFGYVQGTKAKAVIKNCTFNGSITAANVGAFINTCSAPKIDVISEGNLLNGRLLASSGVHVFGCNTNVTGGSTKLKELENSVEIGTAAVVTKVSPSTTLFALNTDNHVVVNKANGVEYYIVAVVFSVDMADNSSGGYPRYITERVEQFEEETYTTNICKYGIIERDADYSTDENRISTASDMVIWIENGCYNIYSEGYKKSNNKATVYVYGYSNGSIVTYQTMAYSY